MSQAARLQKQFTKLIKDAEKLPPDAYFNILNVFAGQAYNALNKQAQPDVRRYAILADKKLYVARICSYEEQAKIIENNNGDFPENKIQEIDAWGRVVGDPVEKPPISIINSEGSKQ